MRTFTSLRALAFLAALLPAACATQPDEPASVVHGCWISPHDKPGVPVDTLRLLTMGKPDADYAGDIVRYENGGTTQVATLSFARDGSQVKFARNGDEEGVHVAAEPPAAGAPALTAGWKRLAFATHPLEPPYRWLIADAGPEHLRIFLFAPEWPPEILFDGARDGCD